MLILVRHGQSEANITDKYSGQGWDAELTELGKKQARRSAEFVRDNYKIDKIYSSDLSRAYMTAKALADMLGMEITTNKDLREIFGGDWEKQSYADLRANYKEEYELWLNDIGNGHPTNGESVAEMSDRFVSIIKKLAMENVGKTAYVATHATPIRALVTYVEGKGLGNMKNIPWVSNASLTFVDYEDGKLVLKSVGQDAHLGDLATEPPRGV